MSAFATFSELDSTSSASIVLVQFLHMKPTASEAASYFSTLAQLLNDKTQETPCALVFDVSQVKLSDGIPLQFFSRHQEFNTSFLQRINLVCKGVGLIMPASLASLRPLVASAISALPKSLQKIQDFSNIPDAVRELKKNLVPLLSVPAHAPLSAAASLRLS
jgi:hypothetical protein